MRLEVVDELFVALHTVERGGIIASDPSRKLTIESIRAGNLLAVQGLVSFVSP